jgi:hypothetical protein
MGGRFKFTKICGEDQFVFFGCYSFKIGHNSANFEAITSRFCMVIDINDTYGLYFHAKSALAYLIQLFFIYDFPVKSQRAPLWHVPMELKILGIV